MRFLSILSFVWILGRQVTAVPDLVTGAIVEQIGNRTVLVEGILKLVIKFQAPSELYDQLIHYEEILKELGQAVSNLTNLRPTYEREFIGSELARMINIEMEMLKEKISTLLTLEWIKPNGNFSESNVTINQTKRIKRGAFDLGGIFLSSLFGLATEGDLKLVNNKVDVVAEAVKASNMAMIQLSHDQNHIKWQIEIMKKQLYKFGHTVEVFEHLQWLNDRYVLFKFQLLKIENYFDFLLKLDDEINTLMAGAQGNSLHNLPKTLFPFEMFKKMNAETEEKLNMKSVAPLTRKTFPYYLNAARIFPRLEHMTMFIIIPYASEKIYHTYKFHSFPTFHENVHKYRVLLTFRLPYMLLSSDLKSITHLNEEDFRLCNHVFIPASTYLCFLSHPLYDFPLSNSNDLAPQRCQETIIRMNTSEKCEFSPYTSNETLVKRVKNRIYLSSTSPLQAVVNCPSGNAQPFLQELTVLAPGCSFSSRGISLLNYREVNGKLLLPMPTREIPVIDVLDFSGQFPMETSNFTPVISYSDHDALIHGKIQESTDLLKKAKEMSTHDSYVPHIATGISLTTALILSGILAYFCYRQEPRYAEINSGLSRRPRDTSSTDYRRNPPATITPEKSEETKVEMNPVVCIRPFSPLEPLMETSFETSEISTYCIPRPGTPRPVCVTPTTSKNDDGYVIMPSNGIKSPTPAERHLCETPPSR